MPKPKKDLHELLKQNLSPRSYNLTPELAEELLFFSDQAKKGHRFVRDKLLEYVRKEHNMPGLGNGGLRRLISEAGGEPWFKS